ncbi:MAG: limonene-1,2-epoxide hydrolase family protein [Myxococcota bacterium]
MSQNTELIDRFVAAWGRRDIDDILSFFAADAVYTNIPIDPPNEGLEAIRKTIEGFLGMSEEIEFVVSHTAEAPGIVMNERVDRFLIGGRWVEASVMGVFEIADGKIQHWRDYFDLAGFQSQMAGG